MNLTSDAILYYADNPVDFVEDVIRARPDQHQRAILTGEQDDRTLRPRHRQECCRKLAGDLVFDHAPLPEDSMHRTHPAPAMGHSVG